ncbi:MAG: AraC family transcriptional regulator [Bacteroidota bacterium]
MTFYEAEIKRIRSICYANDKQLETVIAVRNFIDQHFEETLDLDQLSRVGLTSKYHLLRLFKQYYGLTPRQYLIDKRIAASKEQLRKGTSVTECCWAVGFASLGSFSTLFKARTGQSPREYQKEQLSRST